MGNLLFPSAEAKPAASSASARAKAGAKGKQGSPAAGGRKGGSARGGVPRTPQSAQRLGSSQRLASAESKQAAGTNLKEAFLGWEFYVCWVVEHYENAATPGTPPPGSPTSTATAGSMGSVSHRRALLVTHHKTIVIADYQASILREVPIADISNLTTQDDGEKVIVKFQPAAGHAEMFFRLLSTDERNMPAASIKALLSMLRTLHVSAAKESDTDLRYFPLFSHTSVPNLIEHHLPSCPSPTGSTAAPRIPVVVGELPPGGECQSHDGEGQRVDRAERAGAVGRLVAVPVRAGPAAQLGVTFEHRGDDVLVGAVEPGSAAAGLGLQRHAVFLGLDDQPAVTAAMLARRMQAHAASPATAPPLILNFANPTPATTPTPPPNHRSPPPPVDTEPDPHEPLAEPEPSAAAAVDAHFLGSSRLDAGHDGGAAAVSDEYDGAGGEEPRPAEQRCLHLPSARSKIRQTFSCLAGIKAGAGGGGGKASFRDLGAAAGAAAEDLPSVVIDVSEATGVARESGRTSSSEHLAPPSPLACKIITPRPPDPPKQAGKRPTFCLGARAGEGLDVAVPPRKAASFAGISRGSPGSSGRKVNLNRAVGLQSKGAGERWTYPSEKRTVLMPVFRPDSPTFEARITAALRRGVYDMLHDDADAGSDAGSAGNEAVPVQ